MLLIVNLLKQRSSILSIVFAQVLRYIYVHNLFRKVQTILLIDKD